jgi:hypothetical protein
MPQSNHGPRVRPSKFPLFNISRFIVGFLATETPGGKSEWSDYARGVSTFFGHDRCPRQAPGEIPQKENASWEL